MPTPALIPTYYEDVHDIFRFLAKQNDAALTIGFSFFGILGMHNRISRNLLLCIHFFQQSEQLLFIPFFAERLLCRLSDMPSASMDTTGLRLIVIAAIDFT